MRYQKICIFFVLVVFLGGCKGGIKYKPHSIEDKYRTYYEVFVYSFCDGNDDGIGDIKGLISKLDYIEEMGFTGIWLMPIMPSPTYHKYDVTDYYTIDPEYGTMDDFKNLIEECGKRGIRVILDLVLNHTSDQHPWFRSAVKSLSIEPCGMDTCIYEELCRGHNPYVGYYHFTDAGPSASYTSLNDVWRYESVFWPGMPDLNLENATLRKELENIMKFWLNLGADGFRLDAAKEYFTGNPEKNIAVLTWINDYVKGISDEYYIVAEVWDSFVVYNPYYKSGIDSVFNFAFADGNGKITKTINLKGSANGGKSFGDYMVFMQAQRESFNQNAIDAPFFTNHDTGRMAGFFGQDERKMKLAAGMNLLMSGNVFVYYGEEIGMSGSGKDENKRAPMLWSEKEGDGMTNGPAGMEKVVSAFPAADEQAEDPLSIYSYYKEAIRIRNIFPAIARGSITAAEELQNDAVCAVNKIYQTEKLLLLYNKSEEEQTILLDEDKYPKADLGGSLSVDEQKVVFKDLKVILPPYGIAVIVYKN